MGLTSYCRNCGQPKTPAFYGELYCEGCTTAIKEAREYATREKLDPSAAQRAALAERAHDTHRNRPDPRFPMTKADVWAANAPKEGPRE